MPIYDVVMFVVLGAAVWFGYRKGLAWQIASLAAVIVSYIVSVKFREPVSQFIQAEAPWNRIGAMLILFLGTSLLIWTVYARVSKSLKKMELKGFDRQAGAILGAVKGGLLCMVITMFSVSLLGTRIHDQIHQSTTGKYVIRGIGAVSSIVPAELAKYVDPHVENFENSIGQSVHQPLENYPQTPYPNGSQSQNPSLIPPGTTRYPGQVQWQTPATQSGYGTQRQANPYVPQTGTANQSGTYSGQTEWQSPSGYQAQGNWTYTPPTNTNGTYSQGQTSGSQQAGYGNGTQSNTNGQPNNWPNLDVSDSTRQLFDAAIQHGADRLKGAINGGNQQR